jgi:hypothetical protein
MELGECKRPHLRLHVRPDERMHRGYRRAPVEVSGLMKKSELLKAIPEEILRHDLDTFMNPQHKIVETGCSTCQKHFGTIEQFKRHLTDDVLPPLLDRLSTGGQT